ncbi:lipid A deacylase LpxR family protein [Hymenobacter saemangeumensis]|uniref:Lipid A deacylase LpxR family protein n=1 Tax=Hymenobacter saemangeumensis TaxID=1084522 RepID=A0ABP8IMN4_9BACT
MGLLGLFNNCPAQAAPATDTTKVQLSSDRLISYTFANDAFFRTDYYFTQGMSLTLVLPALSRLPTRHVLPGPREGTLSHYGLKILYDGFTPLRIQDPDIRYGDRPYASYIYATFFHAQTSGARRWRLSSGLQLGVIGPAAGAKGFQTAVHRWLAAPTPRGWDYQVQNDLVLGYELGGERQLLAIGSAAEVVGTAGAALSTMRSYGSGGLLLRLGRFNPYFETMTGVAAAENRGGLRRLQLYTELRAEARAVGYDATLQGGLLNRDSPYTLPAGAVRRGVLQGAAAAVLAYQGFSVRTVAGWVSPEFAGARHHAWGQLDVRVAF